MKYPSKGYVFKSSFATCVFFFSVTEKKKVTVGNSYFELDMYNVQKFHLKHFMVIGLFALMQDQKIFKCISVYGQNSLLIGLSIVSLTL